MIGFETIGNATVTVFDDIPMLTTDPWIDGKPYFGSWAHQRKIPKEQQENIIKSKYVWLSHGHPDHIDNESLKHFKNSIFLIPDHYGERIFTDFNNSYRTIKIKSNTWFEISKNIRIKSFSDFNQDASLIIEIMGKDIILNVNDGSLLGWKSTIKKIVKNYKNRFLLKLVSWGDADMINIYDENGNFIKPPYAHKPPLGKRYSQLLKNFGCNFAIPFSSMHKYSRSDSIHMNEFVAEIEEHHNSFVEDEGNLLPAYIFWDSIQEDYKEIKTERNKQNILTPELCGDNYSDQLSTKDKQIISKYFNGFEGLAKYFEFITFRVGKSDFNIKLSKINNGCGIIFECPRNSLMIAIKYEIFDDLLIGNFMKTTIIGHKGLHPYFTPYVTKYGDNGKAKSLEELSDYFNFYKLNTANYWMDLLQYKSEAILRDFAGEKSKFIVTAKKIKDRYF